MHFFRPVVTRIAISAALTVMNLLIAASVIRFTANQTVFPLVIVLVLFAATSLAQVWRHAVDPTPVK